MDDISAFAFDTGRQIEKIINDRMEKIQDENKYLQFKILDWYNKTKDEDFANHFNINILNNGTNRSN